MNRELGSGGSSQHEIPTEIRQQIEDDAGRLAVAAGPHSFYTKESIVKILTEGYQEGRLRKEDDSYHSVYQNGAE